MFITPFFQCFGGAERKKRKKKPDLTRLEEGWTVAQVIEHLPSMYHALSSNPSNVKK
jgi:hypothetical protein